MEMILWWYTSDYIKRLSICFNLFLDSNSVAVTIHLEDINDNAPELDESKNEKEIFNDFSFTSVRMTQIIAVVFVGYVWEWP